MHGGMIMLAFVVRVAIIIGVSMWLHDQLKVRPMAARRPRQIEFN